MSTCSNLSNSEQPEEKLSESTTSFLQAIADVLKVQLRYNQQLKSHALSILKKQSSQPFRANTIPPISLFDYLCRIKTYSNVSNNTLILSLIYIDKLCSSSQMIITHYNIHRIVLVAIIAAIKYNEDVIYEDAFYAEIGGVSLKELISISCFFLIKIDYRLYVTEEQFAKYHMHLTDYIE